MGLPIPPEIARDDSHHIARRISHVAKVILSDLDQDLEGHLVADLIKGVDDSRVEVASSDVAPVGCHEGLYAMPNGRRHDREVSRPVVARARGATSRPCCENVSASIASAGAREARSPPGYWKLPTRAQMLVCDRLQTRSPKTGDEQGKEGSKSNEAY